MTAQARRPGLATEATQSCSAQTKELDSILANSVELRAAYAVHVVSTCANGVQRGQTYASLQAASKKVERQRQRGLPVSAVLVQLGAIPWPVIGGDDARDDTVSALVVVNGQKVTREAYAAFVEWRDSVAGGDL